MDNFIKKFKRKAIPKMTQEEIKKDIAEEKKDDVEMEKMEDEVKPKDFEKGVETMNDDVADLITKKNKKQTQKEMTKESKEMQRNLAAVYTDKDGHVPDLTKLEKNQRPAWKTAVYTLIIVFAILLIAGIAGFIVFNNLNADKFTNKNISISIDTPIKIQSGEEMEYTVHIKNFEEVSLYNAELKLTYPENFEFISSEPIAVGSKNDTWNFSVLEVGETRQIKFKGKLIAAIDSTQTFRGVLSFKPATINAKYKQESIKDVAVKSSLVDVTIDGLERVLGNQEIEYTIKYQNLSEKDLTNLQLVTTYPEGFVYDSAEPEPSDNHALWEIDSLPAESSGEIKVKGDYSALAEGGNQEFKARLQMEYNGDFYPQAEDSLTTSVIKDQLEIGLIINESGEDQPINFDDLLIYSINYQNVGEEELKNIEITATIDSQIIDWGSLQDDNNGDWDKNTITWTGKEVPQLLKLGAGEEGEINFTIRVKDSTVINDDKISNFSVESSIEARISRSGDFSGDSVIKSKLLTNSINSDLNVAAQARYYNQDNIPLGAGPIEPTVDTQSNYNITIDLANNLHDIKNLKVIATLPENISWINKESHTTGDVIYNKQANKVTWNIDRLSKSASGTNLNFNVSVKPTMDDLGKVLILVSNIKLTGQDADTGADINKTIKAITTAFDDPILGRTTGIVE